MQKVDYSHLLAEKQITPPVVNTYKAIVYLDILSENAEIAKETLELLANSFNHFDDINVTSTEMVND